MCELEGEGVTVYSQEDNQASFTRLQCETKEMGLQFYNDSAIESLFVFVPTWDWGPYSIVIASLPVFIYSLKIQNLNWFGML